MRKVIFVIVAMAAAAAVLAAPATSSAGMEKIEACSVKLPWLPSFTFNIQAKAQINADGHVVWICKGDLPADVTPPETAVVDDSLTFYFLGGSAPSHLVITPSGHVTLTMHYNPHA